MCRPCIRGCTPPDVDSRGCAGPFRCVGPVHVAVPHRTWIQVAEAALYCDYDLCTWWYAPDVDPRASTGPFWCVGPVHVAESLRTWINLPVPALVGVFALFTWLYESGRGSTWLCRPFSVCSPCSRGCTPPDVDPRGCAGPFRCVRPVHVTVRLRTYIHVSVLALFGVLALCSWLYSFGRGST